jgi:topoisomerase-4 subunit A
MSLTLDGLMRQNFLEYASYVIVDRAIPELRDGLKPVQRRILHTLHEMDDGKLHKVANLSGKTMALHPHGNASIDAALTVLANKEYFIERQGNFGNIITGHPAAAARYIECRLTPLARETLFNPALTAYVDSYDGRNKEPLYLPAKLPVVLMLGSEGIAVGMATKIMPHNFQELLEGQIRILQRKTVKLLPDFPQGGLMDATEYEDGAGKIRVRARMEARGSKKIVITEVPYTTTTESLIASIEAAALKGQIKVQAIEDYTTDHAEIHIDLPRGSNAEETIPRLYAYTNCEVSITSSLTVIRDRKPVTLTVTDALQDATKGLKAIIKAELEHELLLLDDRKHWLTLERIFIEKRVYKRIETAKTAEAVRKAVWDGMQAHKKLFVRKMVEDDIKRLLEIRIRRISAYDIEKSRAEVEEIKAKIRAAQRKLKNLTQTSIKWLQEILKRYGEPYARRTTITEFGQVDRKSVARQNIRVTYDPKTSYFGSSVRTGDRSFSMSEYDRVLIVSSDGSYRIVGPEEKVFVPGKALHIEPFDPDKGETFTVVYRTKEKIAYGKRVHIEKYVRGREYQLIRTPGGGRLDLLLRDGTGGAGALFEAGSLGRVHLSFVPMKRQRVKEAEYDLDDLELTSAGARGKRLAPKPVSRIKRLV